VGEFVGDSVGEVLGDVVVDVGAFELGATDGLHVSPGDVGVRLVGDSVDKDGLADVGELDGDELVGERVQGGSWSQ